VQPSRRVKPLPALAALLLAALALGGCQASDERFATETAQADATAQETSTNTPLGDFLMIDGSPVLHIYVPDAGGPARYAMTAERLFRWTDGDWVQTASRADNRVILVDPVRPNRLFRGNHPPCTLEDTDSITLSKSTDGGNTWRAIAAGDNIRPLAIDPTLGDVIYGSDCGLTISTDGGETWREYYRARGHTVVDAAVVGETLLVLEVSLTGRGRLRQINVTVPENPELVTGLVETGHVFDLDADRERIVIGGLQGIIFSLDGGETWTTTREGLEAVTIETPEDIPVEEAEARTPRFGVLTVKLDPTHPQRLFAGTVRGLYISQDAGLTWDVYSSVRTDARIVNIQFAGEGNDIYLTTPRGVMVVPNP
jgi:hypothetical protein